MKRFIFFLLLFSFSSVSGKLIAQEEKKPPEMSPKVYEKVAPVIVKIYCHNGIKIGSGSIVGVIANKMKKYAVILTACHVVASNFEDYDIDLEFHNDIKIRLYQDSTEINANAIKKFAERDNDIALILAEVPKSIDNVIRYYKSSKIKPGQIAAGFGFPDSDNPSQPLGQIVRIESQFFVLDRGLKSGTSGGPMVDKVGRMIGIVISTKEKENEGYAISVNIVEPIVSNWLIEIKTDLKKSSQECKLEKKWKFKKYKSNWERLLKDPVCWVLEAGTAIGIYLLFKKTPDDELIFGKPPSPPNH